MGSAPELIDVRPVGGEDRAWADARLEMSWGAGAARKGELVPLSGLPGFVARLGGTRAGLLTYAIRGDECEVVTLESHIEGRGVARALLDAVREMAVGAGCRRLWLITTNDNLRALALYQRWGMDLCGFTRDAVDESRRTLKPSIPERGAFGIPIAHELELELLL